MSIDFNRDANIIINNNENWEIKPTLKLTLCSSPVTAARAASPVLIRSVSLQQTSGLMELSISSYIYRDGRWVTRWQRRKQPDTIFHVSALKVFRASASKAAISMLNNNQGYSALKIPALAAAHQLRSAPGDSFSISPEERHLSARFSS